MTWCSEVLSHQTNALFSAYFQGDFAHVPPEYKSEGDSWQAIHNPDSVQRYELETGLHFLDTQCVFRPFFRRVFLAYLCSSLVHHGSIPRCSAFALSPDNQSIFVVSQTGGPVTIYNAESGQKKGCVMTPHDERFQSDLRYFQCTGLFHQDSPQITTPTGSGCCLRNLPQPFGISLRHRT